MNYNRSVISTYDFPLTVTNLPSTKTTNPTVNNSLMTTMYFQSTQINPSKVPTAMVSKRTDRPPHIDLCDDQIDGKVSEEDSVNDVSLPMELADVYEPKVIPNTQYKCEACYDYLSKFSRRPPTHVLCHHFVAAHLDKLCKHQCPENEDGVKWICGSIVSCPTYYEARHREEIAEKKITKKKD